MNDTTPSTTTETHLETKTDMNSVVSLSCEQTDWRSDWSADFKQSLEWSLFSFNAPSGTGAERSISLNPTLFGTFWSSSVIKAVVQWQLAKRREACQSTKTRSEVAGSTRKLHRQKGTGRARVGAESSPTRVGGGVALAPKPRTYGYALNKKIRRLGLRMALSSKVSDRGLLLVKNFDLPEAKSKKLHMALQHLGVASKTLLVGTHTEWEALKISANNLPNVLVLPTIGLNVYDVLRHRSLVVSENALRELEARFND